MSQGGQLQQKLNESDTLLQQTSTISGVRPNYVGKLGSLSSSFSVPESELNETDEQYQ